MYTSYAKDVFIALLNKLEKNTPDVDIVMSTAIALVKQARDAFKEN